MADQFSKMYDFERVGGDQRTRLAEMLRANALNQPQGQMVSGWYVPPSMTQNLNQLAQTALGTYMGASLDEERKAKTAELLRELSQGKAVEPTPGVQNFNGLDQRAEGQTPFPVQAPQNELQRLTQRPQSAEQSQISPSMMPRQEQRYIPLTEEEKIGKVMELAQYNPYAAQIWSAQDTARQARLTRGEEKQADREFREQQMLRDQQFRREMAQYAAGNRAEPMVSVMDAQGNPVLMPRSQASGMTPFTPQAQKTVLGQRTAANDVQTALDAASNLMSHEGKSAGTGWSSWTQNIPSTKAKSFGADLNTYKAQGFVSAAQSLKGLGALSEKEGERLIASIGALDPSQSEEDFNKGLKTSAQTIYNKARAAGIEVKLPEVFGENAQPSKPAESAGRWNIRPK